MLRSLFAIATKRDKFDFRFTFLAPKVPTEKRSSLKENYLLSLAAFFPFSRPCFQKWTDVSLLINSFKTLKNILMHETPLHVNGQLLRDVCSFADFIVAYEDT